MERKPRTTRRGKRAITKKGPTITAPEPARVAPPVPLTIREEDITKGFEKQDAYADLELLESALALALNVPAWAPAEPHKSNEERRRYLGDSFPKLRELLTRKYQHFTRLHRTHESGSMRPRRMDGFFLLHVDHWAATPSHSQSRSRLISLLIELRSAVLDSLRVIPPPSSLPPPVVRWDELSTLQQEIVRHVAHGPKPGKEIAKCLGRKVGNIKRVLAALTRMGVLVNIPKREYRIARVPIGSPADLFTTPSQP